jgi:hypothetical protein
MPRYAHETMPTVRVSRLVGPFADRLLAADLPALSAQRRADTVRFIEGRTEVLPSFTRFGVTVIASGFRVLLAVPGGWSVVRALSAARLPLIAEYPRLIRSLGYAYLWERWPDMGPDGTER